MNKAANSLGSIVMEREALRVLDVVEYSCILLRVVEAALGNKELDAAPDIQWLIGQIQYDLSKCREIMSQQGNPQQSEGNGSLV